MTGVGAGGKAAGYRPSGAARPGSPVPGMARRDWPIADWAVGSGPSGTGRARTAGRRTGGPARPRYARRSRGHPLLELRRLQPALREVLAERLDRLLPLGGADTYRSRIGCRHAPDVTAAGRGHGGMPARRALVTLRTMRFGLFVPQGWRLDLAGIDPAQQWAVMRDVAQHADEGPWESVWVYDHFHTVPRPTDEACHEAWTLMAALGAATERVRLGQMCTCMSYRNPAYLAKVAATCDIVSGGRVEMGIGGGWYEHEWRAYGYGFPSAGVRLGMLDEGVQIMRQAWTDGPRHAGRQALPGRRRDRPAAAAAGGRHPAVDRGRRRRR